MSDIYDYLRWRGDLTFNQIPFNEVDALILAQLTYLDYKPFVSPDYSRWTPLQQISVSDYTNYMPSDTRLYTFLKEAGKTKRFGSLPCAAVSDILDPDQITQFMAITFILPDGTCVIAYRGTDTTFTGWKENCYMALTSSISSQQKALEYLEKSAGALCHFNRRKIILTGHSKGGNQAVYATAFATPRTRSKVTAIYNFDGPGFDSTLFSSGIFTHIVPLIHTYVPEESVVGMIMDHEEPYKTVKSSAKGAAQHDLFTWQLNAHTLDYANGLSDFSLGIHKAVNEWLQDIPVLDRQEFVDTLFGVLEGAGLHTLDDLSVSTTAGILRILQKITQIDSEHKRLLHNVFNALFASYRKNKL